MHFQIFIFIILPNVGYWRGSEIVNKNKLSYTKKLLTKVKITKNSVSRMVDSKFHSQSDLPSVEIVNRSRKWHKNGELHRKGDLPAIEMVNGRKEWWKKGKCHRDGNLPAIESEKGTKYWYIAGKLHREAGLPAIERANGDKEWWTHGKRDYYSTTRETNRFTVREFNKIRNIEFGAREWWSANKDLLKGSKSIL